MLSKIVIVVIAYSQLGLFILNRFTTAGEKSNFEISNCGIHVVSPPNSNTVSVTHYLAKYCTIVAVLKADIISLLILLSQTLPSFRRRLKTH